MLDRVSCVCYVESAHGNIFHHGFLPGYTEWIVHGEHTISLPPSQSTNVNVEETFFGQDDIRGLVHDAFGINSLPSNNTQLGDTTIEGDTEESTKNGDHSDEGVSYKSLLEECDKELYVGCKYSNLSFILHLYHIKCIGGISNKTFSMILELLRDAFPHVMMLPSSAYEAKKFTKDLGLGYEKIHACPNDCMLYWDDKAGQQSCHICKALRYKSDEVGGSSKSRKSNNMAKVLRYFPLIPRLKRLYKCEKTAKNIRFMTLILKQPNLCPSDAKDWKECCAAMLIAELRRRFCIPQGESVDKVLSAMFSVKRRTVKYRLKHGLYQQAANKLNEANGINGLDAQEKNYTDDELLAALDLLEPRENFLEHQWRVYKSHLRKPIAKRLSLCGKKARNDQVHNHTTGAVSFARTKDIYKVDNKREPNDFESFHLCYKTKDDTYLQEVTRDMMVIANQEISSKVKELVGPEGIAEDAVVAKIAREVINKLLGNKEPHCYGAGVTKSQISKFCCDLKRLRGEDLADENSFLKEKNMDQKLNEVYGMLKLLPAFPDLDNVASTFAAGTTGPVRMVRVYALTFCLQNLDVVYATYFRWSKVETASEFLLDDHRSSNIIECALVDESSGIRGDIKCKAVINCEIGQLSLYQEKQHVFNVLNAKPFEITFLKFVKLVIISTYNDPIQMLVVMPFDDLKLCDSDDSMLE
nr:tetratricopeptide-like helical domain, DYW domain protein [Tanacetum cinerariifolium]